MSVPTTCTVNVTRSPNTCNTDLQHTDMKQCQHNNIPESLFGSSSSLMDEALPLDACERRFCYNTNARYDKCLDTIVNKTRNDGN